MPRSASSQGLDGVSPGALTDRSADPKSRRARGTRAIAGLRSAGSLLLVAAVLAVFAARVPAFLDTANLGLILAQSCVLGILAVGLTLVLITGGTDVVAGGIDLSLAGTLGLSAAVFAGLNRAGAGDAACVAAALGTGLAVGLANAIAVLHLRIPPLLATLATMNISAGLELVITENTTIPAASPLIEWLGGPGPLDVPILGYLLPGLIFAFAAGLHATPLGPRAYAVGAHPEAARAAGLSIGRYRAGSYLASGLSGGGAGIASVAFLNSATGGSADMLLPVVATAFLGAMFSRRRVPTVTGTLLAALFVGSLTNGFQLLHVSTYWVNGIEGALILGVVGATAAPNGHAA